MWSLQWNDVYDRFVFNITLQTELQLQLQLQQRIIKKRKKKKRKKLSCIDIRKALSGH